MAEPKIDSSFYTFLAYDFAHQEDHANRLAVIRDKITGVKNLEVIIVNGTLARWKQKLTKADSLFKVMDYVRRYQMEWHSNFPGSEKTLERQCAWLERKVQVHNAKHSKDYISYENPFAKKVKARLIMQKESEDSKITEISAVPDVKEIKVDRLTTYQELQQSLKPKLIGVRATCDRIGCKAKNHWMVSTASFFLNVRDLKPLVTNMGCVIDDEHEVQEIVLRYQAPHLYPSAIAALVGEAHEGIEAGIKERQKVQKESSSTAHDTSGSSALAFVPVMMASCHAASSCSACNHCNSHSCSGASSCCGGGGCD